MNLDVIIDIQDIDNQHVVKQKIKQHAIEFYAPVLTPEKLYIKIEKSDLDTIKKQYPKIKIKSQRKFSQFL